MSKQPFKPRSFADALREAEARAAELGLPRGAAGASDPESYDVEWAVCRCGRLAPALELVDVSGIAEVPGTYACSGCRGDAFRKGIISRSEFARKLGAPESTVASLRSAELRQASHPPSPVKEKNDGHTP